MKFTSRSLVSLTAAGAAVLAAPGLPAHTQSVAVTPHIAVICEDAGSTGTAIHRAAVAQVGNASRALLGQTPASIYWLAVTDNSFDTPAVGSIIVQRVDPLHVTTCGNPFDVRCRQDNDHRRQVYEQRMARARASVNGQTHALSVATLPRPHHKPDLVGCLGRAGQLFKRTTRNYLILIGSMEPAPAANPPVNLYHADLDVIWIPAGNYGHAHATEQAWQRTFRALDLLDQAWIQREQLSTWEPVQKS